MYSTTASIGRKVFAGMVWSTTEIWGGQVIQLMVFFVLARLLTPAAFGIAALVTVFLVLSSLLTTQGLVDALIQARELHQDQLSTVFWFCMACAVFLAAALVCLAGPISWWLGQPALVPFLRCGAPILLLDTLASVQEAQFRRELRFRPLAVRRTCANLVGGLFGIVAALAGAGAYALIGARAVTAFTGVLLLWTQSKWRPAFAFSFQLLKELLPYSTQTFGSAALAFVNGKTDDLIIGSVLGPIALGFYSVAYRMLLVLNTTVTAVVTRVTFPAFSRLQFEPTRLVNAFQRTTHAAALLSFPVFTGMALLAHIIIPIFFGVKWRPSIPSMQVLAIVGLFQNSIILNTVLCRALKRPGYNTVYLSVNAIANVSGFLLFVRQGILAVALVLLINTILLSPLSFIFVRKLTGLKLLPYLRQFRGAVLSSALAGLVLLALGRIWPAPRETWTFLALCMAVFGVAYAGSLLLFDRAFVRELLRFVSSSLPGRVKERRLFLLLDQCIARLR